MKTARIQDGHVAEFLEPVTGHSLEDCFHASVLAECLSVPDEVQLGWIRQDDGTFVAPTPVPAPAPATPEAAP